MRTVGSSDRMVFVLYGLQTEWTFYSKVPSTRQLISDSLVQKLKLTLDYPNVIRGLLYALVLGVVLASYA